MKIRIPYQNSPSPGKRLLVESIAVLEQGWAGNLLSPALHKVGRSESLRASSWRSLWSLQLFITVSVAAFLVRDFNLYTVLPESVLQILGCPPPPTLAHIALGGYVFTAMTPLVINVLNREPPVAQWRHLGYRSAFYCFYLFSATLATHFFLVFATGLFLYLVEQACICIAINRSGHGNSQPA